MNQNQIGKFLRQLRQNRNWTQAQLAQRLNVSNRSVSRWENGATMPDLSLLIELAELYEVSVDEILDGGQQKKTMNENRVIAKVASYSSEQEAKVSRRMQMLFASAIVCMIIFAIIDSNNLVNEEPWNSIASICMGFITGILVTGFLYSSQSYRKIMKAKNRLFHR